MGLVGLWIWDGNAWRWRRLDLKNYNYYVPIGDGSSEVSENQQNDLQS